MPTIELQTDIAGEERAIRHLIGEKAAVERGLAYHEAKLKLDEAALRNRIGVKSPTTEVKTATVPHGARFVDLSSYQSHVNLAYLRAADPQLVVFKASEGTDYVDGYFAARWHDAHAAGFPHRGAYHFLHPNIDGAEQAQFMLNAIRQNSGTITAQDILICDAEVSDGASAATVARCIADFGNTLRGHAILSGTAPKLWLYTGGPFAREFGVRLAPYDGHWLPAYVTDPKPYYVFGTPIAWQYTQTGHASGVTGSCDTSIVL